MLEEKGYDKQFVRAYLACVTFADEQVGRLLDAWDASAHSNSGYIVLWSDHGYNLGEKEAWSKMKPWYDSARCNLIIAGPGVAEGITCDKAVSLQDLYPDPRRVTAVDAPLPLPRRKQSRPPAERSTERMGITQWSCPPKPTAFATMWS